MEEKMGHFGDAACFSFYITKNLTTVKGRDGGDRTR